MKKELSNELTNGDQTPVILQIKGKQQFMGKEIPVVLGGFGENCKVVSDKTVAEIHNTEAREVRRLIKDNLKRFKESIDFIDLKKGVGDTHTLDLTELSYSKQAITQAEHIYLLSERGYAKLIKIMDTDLAWEIHDKLIDEYFHLREATKNNQLKLSKKHELAIKIYDGGSDAIIAHKELVKIEVAEETARLKDGTNKILSAQQVVDMLCVRKLTTTLLHEWFVENGFGELVRFPYERKRIFQPSQKFIDYVAVKGYSLTGTTVKGNKIKVVYSTEMVDRLLDRHMASIVQYVKVRSKLD